MASIIAIADSWRATVRLKGHKQQSKNFKLKKDAQRWAETLEYKLRTHELTTAETVKVDDLIDEYLTLREISGREVTKLYNNNTVYRIKHLREAFGSRYASRITTADYITWVKDSVREGRGQHSLAQELSLLQTCFRRGAAVLNINLPDYLSKAILIMSQMNLIEPSSGKRTRTATGLELNRLMHHLPDDELRCMVRVASILGFRRSEFVNLKWSDFDAENKMLWVRDRKHPRAKKGNSDNVPLLFNSFELINDLPRTSEKIFPTHSIERISLFFLRACRACTPPIENLHFHDCRHTAITSLFENGLQIQQVALISGHRDWKHLKRYTNLEPIDLHEDFPNGNLTTDIPNTVVGLGEGNI